MNLQANWEIQSSCEVKATGAELSKVGYRTDGWHRAEVPATIVAALVADKTYPDPYFGTNLRTLPGMNYPAGAIFANLAMPADSPFRCSWWYRTEFQLPANYHGKTIWLHFDGINYRANIWLNGRRVADVKDVAGTFRRFEFNVSALAAAGESSALAVEVFPPSPTDLAITWVDWNPTPPDKDAGLWKDVYITASGDISLRFPFVSSRLAPGLEAAELTVSAVLRNNTAHEVRGTFQAEIEGIRVAQQVELEPSETKTVRFTTKEYPQLKLSHPRLWWPYQMGKPEMYAARLAAEISGRVSDSATVRFGVRQVSSEMTPEGHRLFRINGRKILIRGGGWASDMLLRWSPVRTEAELNYVRDLGLNTIRLEGKLERDEFYDMADRKGILIMAGWCCCDMWEHWPKWKEDQYAVARASLEDQVRGLRNHPSVLVWLYGSDSPPPGKVEEMYLKVLKDQEWPNPSLSSASQNRASVTGPSGVKMLGPYDYVPPNYWLTDDAAGGAFGFNTETGPGPAIPPVESLKRFLPPDHLWPIDEVWNYHAGGLRFANLSVFTRALEERYGKAENLDDFLRKSQAMAYEGERAMFEAYARNKYQSTGVIQWMLNNAWPSLIWHLYDYYLTPAGGYFGTKKACEMTHAQYSYDDRSIVVVNNRDSALPNMTVTAKIYNLDAQEKFSRAATLDVPADSAVRVFVLPEVEGLSAVYFVRLSLTDGSDKPASENFYWLSTRPDVLTWSKRVGTAYTPESAYADYRELARLSRVKLSVAQKTETDGTQETIRVRMRNSNQAVAFMVRLRLTKEESGEDVAPILWEDNYISLLPGEVREIAGRYDAAALDGNKPLLRVEGWNVIPESVAAPAKQTSGPAIPEK